MNVGFLVIKFSAGRLLHSLALVTIYAPYVRIVHCCQHRHSDCFLPVSSSLPILSREVKVDRSNGKIHYGSMFN